MICNLYKNNEIRFKFPHFFAYFFNFLYFVCLVPFHVHLPDGGEPVITTSKLQRALCICLHAGAFAISTWMIRIPFAYELRKDPAKAFKIVDYLVVVVFPLVFFNVVWSQKSRRIFAYIPACTKTWKVSFITF